MHEFRQFGKRLKVKPSKDYEIEMFGGIFCYLLFRSALFIYLTEWTIFPDDVICTCHGRQSERRFVACKSCRPINFTSFSSRFSTPLLVSKIMFAKIMSYAEFYPKTSSPSLIFIPCSFFPPVEYFSVRCIFVHAAWTSIFRFFNHQLFGKL